MNTLDKIRRRIDRDGLYAADLSDKLEGVLSYIVTCWINGFLPTLDDIAKAKGLRNHQQADHYVRMLRERGYLEDSSGRRCMALGDKAIELAIDKAYRTPAREV